ncbi:CDP-alcohol phosphatidyltransferase family protein [Patescibacteria group bacterium]|nr:CDP-alcohol phosphatidyltransferase family protein [Patescibacteria group bacterium]
MFEKLRDPLRKYVDFTAKFFAWMPPNILTIVGLFLTLVPVYFFSIGEARIGGFALFITLFDFLDGAVARYTNRVTLFGEVLDATFDRIADGLIIFSLGLGSFISWPFAFILLIGFYLVSYTRARVGEASAKKVKLNVGLAQRGDRILLLILAGIFYTDGIETLKYSFNTIELVSVLIGVLVWHTVLLRLWTAYKKLKDLDYGK